MAMPSGIGAIDCMISFPAADFTQYDFIRQQLKDSESTDFEFPVEYMFKGVPKELYGSGDPLALTLGEMDKYGIDKGLIGCEGEVSIKALTDHPDRFRAMIVEATNPVHSLADSKRMIEALRALEFVVVIDVAMKLFAPSTR